MITNSYKNRQILFIIKDNQRLEDLLQIKVGKRIQQIRIEKKLSQQDLAAKCNFEKSNMSRLESGGVNPTLSTLEKVANALEITLAELFSFI
jgi:transcriptional regulator with XRE-family HTH domain